MVGGSSTLNLSLLSRGVGEITKNGHERIDVVFEPQDYYNFVDSSKRIYLPPIRPTYSFESPQFSTTDNANKPHKEIPIPKTFTTRKGALLLFSEDLAHKTRQAHHVRRGHHDHLDDRASQLSKSADEIDLRTVDDLAKYILSYGGQQRHDYDDDNEVYLKFVHGRRKRDLFNRQIRPGFSAKRYLSSWTKCWDDQVLEKVISKGYLTEKSLFYYNPLMPHLQRRLNDDMSHYPTPYKLMRSMLMSPGSLSGYTFYRVRPESAETIGTQDFDLYGVAPDQAQSIKVISTKDGVQREVTYASLDKKAQEEVLTDLLVKSAVHYAMKKQQEYFEDSLARAMDTNKIQGTHEGREITPSMPQFDMENAVDSLLDANKGKAIIETDFPEDKSQISERSGSMRTKPLKHKTRHGKERASVRSHTSSPASEDKEYIGNVPVVSFRDGSGSPSSVPQLPHIPGAIPLTPIGETSREQTTVIQLPPIGRDSLPAFNILPPTPQHTAVGFSTDAGRINSLRNQVLEEAETEDEWGVRGSRDPGTTTYTDGDYDRKRREERIKKRESVTGIVPSGGTHLQSSTESLGGPASVHSVPASKVHRTQWKGSQQSLKSYGSKRGPGSQAEESSVKGSVVIGPDGEPINVGGTIAPQPRQDHIDQFHDANIVLGKDLISDESEGDEPDEWRHSRRLPRGQRDMMKNYANKRAPQEHKLDVHTDQKIDYTSGDIDATLSINSWSYMPRDDPEFDGIKKCSSLHSLPAIQDMTKEITILSRATEKSEAPLEPGEPETPLGVKEPVPTDDTMKPMTGSEGPGTDTLQSMLQSPNVTMSGTPGGRITSILDTPFNMPEEIVPEESEEAEEEQKIVEEEKEPSPSPVDQRRMSRLSRRQSRQSVISEKQVEGTLSRQTSEKKLSRAPSVEEVISRSQSESKEERRKSVLSRRASKESLLQRNMSRQSVTMDVETQQALKEETNDKNMEDVFDEQSDEADSELKVEGEQITVPPPKDPTPEPTPRASSTEEEQTTNLPSSEEALSERADSAKSKVSEKEIVDALSDHAQQIAANILSRSSSGRDLEQDVRKAASLWMETHPARSISRSHSVQDQTVVREIMDNTKRKSAGPTAGEYRELIKENLATALSNTSGVDKEEIPADAEVSPELIEALSKESVSPEDLEIVKDEDSGKNLIRSKSQVSMAMGGVKEGHIFVPVAKNGRRASASIPADRVSNADIGELDVINYGEKESVVSVSKDESEKLSSSKTPSVKSASSKSRSEKAPSEKTPSERGSKASKSQPPSIMGESIAEETEDVKDDASEKKSRVSFKDEVEVEDEFQKAVEEIEQKSQSSIKSGKSGTSPDGKKSKASIDKATTPATKKKEEFVVGKVDTKDEIKALYGQPEPPQVEPTPPTMAKEKAPQKDPTPPPQPPAKTPPKSAEKKKPPPVVSEIKPPVAPAKQTNSEEMDRKKSVEDVHIETKKPVAEEKIKSASTAKQSSTSRSEEMAEIQQGFKDEIKNLFGKVPAKSDKGRVDYKDELKHLFSGEIPSGKKPKTTKGKPKKKSIPSPVKKTTAPPAKTKKPKKGKKKEESPEPKAPEESPPPEPPKEPTPPPPEPEPPKEEEKPIDYESERRKSIVKNINTNIKKAPSKESVNSELKSEESFEFNIVRDTPSPSPPPQAPSIPSVEEEPEEEEEELLDEEDDEAARLRMISNKEARAAKRAAQAEKRKQEVEKRRKEREDQLRREKEEFERQQLLKAELEEERRRAEEQRRLRREQQDEEREKEEREEMEKLRKQKLEEDRERKRREDYQRKLEEMKKRQQEEEQRRHEEMLRKQKEDEVRRQEELEMLAKMKEEERLEYERQKKLEEEERLRKEEEEKRLREEEAKRAMEEARRLAEEMARKQAEMEARLKFNRTLQVEANGMKHSHDITRAFVFSYFELLQWLGLDIPEFELLKLNQY